MKGTQMILNLRYHIFTIAAIFAALGLGILIGSSLIANETLVHEQKRLISNIGEEMKELREENNTLQAKNKVYKKQIVFRKQIEEKLLALGFKDSLADQKYIILLNNWFDTESNRIKNVFDITGANLSIRNKMSTADITQEYQVIVGNENEDLNKKFGEIFAEIPKDKLIKSNSKDIMGVLISLIERELNER
jgi:uncharacterized membrane protein YhiD involved in acid resistance